MGFRAYGLAVRYLESFDDRQTVAVITNFYRALARGEAVGAALRSAKLEALRRGAPVRDWASSAVIGDALVEVPLSAPSRTLWGVLLGATALVVVGGTLAVRRTRRTA